MELSNPHTYGAKGVKKPTHDFLSLYTSDDQQDPISSIPDDYLKTQDFLRPLEHVVKNVGNEGAYIENSKSFTPSPPTIVEHILPGGMGTYSISHISYVNQIQSQKVPKPRGIVISTAQSSSSDNNDENSNCSSYTGSGFTLWEDSNVNKGKTRKENIAGTRHTMRDEGIKIGVPWMTTMEQPSQSSSIHNNPSTTFSSLSSSHPSSGPKNRYVVDTLKFGKGVQQEEDNDEVFVIKKEPTFHNKGAVRVDSANHDQKPNSPRSKHSATEQRRRSKINDRFSMLRGILPHGDQKRDKASFLLEVIEYIQFLQEKVHKYEDLGQGWTNEPPKKIPLNNGPTNDLFDQPQLPTSSLGAFKETSQHPAASHTHISTPDTITASQAQPQLSHSISCKTDYSITSDKLKDQEIITESGTVSISTIYSQGLSSALTEALKSSGVDLSHANISVKIDLGKTSKTSTLDSLPPDLKENETPSIDQSLVHSSGEGFKRLKTCRW